MDILNNLKNDQKPGILNSLKYNYNGCLKML